MSTLNIVIAKVVKPHEELGTHYSVFNMHTGEEMITPYDYSAFDAARAAVELVLSAQGVTVESITYYGYDKDQGNLYAVERA